MYKVVIIEDEPIIVEGLSRLLPWEKYNWPDCSHSLQRKRKVGSDTQGEAGHPFFRYLHAGTGRAVHDRGTESRISGYGDQHSDRFQGIAHFSRVFKHAYATVSLS